MPGYINPNPTKYLIQSDGGLKCKVCQSDIMSKSVLHSIWYDGPGPCAGGGEVETRYIPYCPKCES